MMSFFVFLVVFVCSALYVGSGAFGAILAMFFMLGLLLVLGVEKASEEKGRATQVYLLSFSVYLVFALYCYEQYSSGGDFYFPDEAKFSSWAVSSAQYGWLGGFWDCFDTHRDQTLGVYLYSIPYLIFRDVTDPILCYPVVVTFAGVFNALTYMTLRFYTDEGRAFFWAKLYILGGLVFFYSGYILRDVQVGSLLAFSIWLFHGRFSLARCWVFLVLIGVASLFRPETGILVLILCGFYVFFKGRASPYRVLLWGGVVMCGAVSIGFSWGTILEVVTGFIGGASSYMEFSADRVGDSGGVLGRYVYSLPIGVRNIFIIVNAVCPIMATISCFGGYLYGFFHVSSLPLMAALIFQMFLFLKTVRNWKILWKNSPKDWKYLVVFALIFLALNSFNMDQRRIFSIYSVFLFAVAWLEYRKIRGLLYISLSHK